RAEQETVVVGFKKGSTRRAEIIAFGSDQPAPEVEAGSVRHGAMNICIRVAAPGMENAGRHRGAYLLPLRTGRGPFAGNAIDHAADGVRPILRRVRPLFDLDPLYCPERDVLQRG